MMSRRFLALSVLAGAILLPACSTPVAKIDFRCNSSRINDGNLLTVDVVRATEGDVREIQQLGEKWFYEAKRMSMGEKVKTVAFPAPDGTCDRMIEVPAAKGEKFLVVIADYKFQTADASQYVKVLPAEKWAGRKIRISIQERELIITSQ
ncbi:MAG: hypothetical protein DIJKHBIC_04559 [Thermoanaerobaculia bacterium]|nr:hypothetical protein [Thermoanaerobaculia bacterium]